ncbi:VacJ family lipoprotein [Thermomonas sp. HDW16]|uniref:MlaA family lipoprotein n=1 Tax=Thermomonas sp. HDW16 TaxID=2714945 RepID=UPI00140D5A96|nr:VacJ family lipoprotein [Thermomonas sp. HDW16]QIL19435.1 VacJ family lipoprotein [Thermomonas sp. HDW16]
MSPTRPLLSLLLCILLGACATAGNGKGTPPAIPTAIAGETPAAAPETVAATAENAGNTADAVVNTTPAEPAAAQAESPAVLAQEATAAEDDFAAIYGVSGTDGAANGEVATTSTVRDPWEKYNRQVHGFNQAIDRALAKPVARAYVAVVPQPIRTGIGNVLDNLGQPVTFVNNLLQGDPRGAANTLGRFLLNSTVGIVGIFDVASRAKMPERNEDFGQTLAVWGWKQSRYVELPFLGPRTVRDVLGLGGDYKLWPVGYIERDRSRIVVEGLQLVDSRAQLLPIENIGEGAVDEYTLFRDVWLQRRNYQIKHSGRRSSQTDDAPVPQSDLPSYLMEDNDVTPETSGQPGMPPADG